MFRGGRLDSRKVFCGQREQTDDFSTLGLVKVGRQKKTIARDVLASDPVVWHRSPRFSILLGLRSHGYSTIPRSLQASGGISAQFD